MLSHPAVGWFLAAALALLGLRHWLPQGLSPEATHAGSQPQDLGLEAHAVRIPTLRGLSLFAWYPPSPLPQAAPAVVLLHGWVGNAARSRLPRKRCTGRDSPSCCQRHATMVAATMTATLRCRALPKTGAARHVRYFPVGWLVNRYVERVIGARFRDIAPLHTLARAQCPVLLLHGRQDRLVPVDDVRQLWQHRGAAQVGLLGCDGSHEGFDHQAEVSRHILDFLHAPADVAARLPASSA